MEQASEMECGTITKLVVDRGFGFLQNLDGGGKVFFHCTALGDRELFASLVEGQQVRYVTEETPKGVQAKRVEL